MPFSTHRSWDRKIFLPRDIFLILFVAFSKKMIYIFVRIENRHCSQVTFSGEPSYHKTLEDVEWHPKEKKCISANNEGKMSSEMEKKCGKEKAWDWVKKKLNKGNQKEENNIFCSCETVKTMNYKFGKCDDIVSIASRQHRMFHFVNNFFSVAIFKCTTYEKTHRAQRMCIVYAEHDQV